MHICLSLYTFSFFLALTYTIQNWTSSFPFCLQSFRLSMAWRFSRAVWLIYQCSKTGLLWQFAPSNPHCILSTWSANVFSLFCITKLNHISFASETVTVLGRFFLICSCFSRLMILLDFFFLPCNVFFLYVSCHCVIHLLFDHEFSFFYKVNCSWELDNLHSSRASEFHSKFTFLPSHYRRRKVVKPSQHSYMSLVLATRKTPFSDLSLLPLLQLCLKCLRKYLEMLNECWSNPPPSSWKVSFKLWMFTNMYFKGICTWSL